MRIWLTVSTFVLAMTFCNGVSAQLTDVEKAQDDERSGELRIVTWDTEALPVVTSDEFAANLKNAELREVIPLALATSDGSGTVRVDDRWTSVTRTMYNTYLAAPVLPGHKRVLVLKFRDANNGQRTQGDEVRYRIYFSWVREPGSSLYGARTYWGGLDEGGVTTFPIREAKGGRVVNPHARGRHGEHYFQIQCRAKGCVHVVTNATLLVYDVSENDRFK